MSDTSKLTEVVVHTPGPWGLWSTEGQSKSGAHLYSVCRDDTGPGRDGHLSVHAGNHVCVAEARGASEDEAAANARLIAAAPELLEVLELAETYLSVHSMSPAPTLLKVRAVIAKATGAA